MSVRWMPLLTLSTVVAFLIFVYIINKVFGRNYFLFESVNSPRPNKKEVFFQLTTASSSNSLLPLPPTHYCLFLQLTTASSNTFLLSSLSLCSKGRMMTSDAMVCFPRPADLIPQALLSLPYFPVQVQGWPHNV